MKPYDGGQWVGVSHIKDPAELKRAYDSSGQRLMHLQAAVDGFDVFARSLSIGAETMVMKFRPDLPMHDRYAVAHDFLTPETGDEVLTISRLINAFFRWEFNSCETLVRGHRGAPDRLRQRVARRGGHEPALLLPVGDEGAAALVRVLRGDRPPRRRLDLDTRRYFEIGDREDLTYEEKLAGYRKLADEYFEVERYQDFCDSRLPHVDEMVSDWIDSPGLRRPARRDRRDHVPAPRARAVRRALPRADRPVGTRARVSADTQRSAPGGTPEPQPVGGPGHQVRDAGERDGGALAEGDLGHRGGEVEPVGRDHRVEHLPVAAG